MFIILSFIAYYVYQNDPPVIFAYNKDGVIKDSLYENAKKAKDSGHTITIIRPDSSKIPIRISNINSFNCVPYDQIFVFPNNTDLQKIVDEFQPEEVNVNIDKLGDICDTFKNYENNGLVIVTDHYPEFKKVGYSNPFTPGVWNCFFFIIFTISFIIWSMIHYSNIDVQTRFAKKLY